MGLYLVQEIKSDRLYVIDKIGIATDYRIFDPWTQFLPYIEKFDEIYIESKSNNLDEEGILVIDPHFLVAVTTAIDAISCPRKAYVKYYGAEEQVKPSTVKRMVEGNLLHKVFSQRIALQTPIEDTISDVLRNSKTEILTSDIDEAEIRKYLLKNAGVMNTLSISGKTEIDCQNWEYGLTGKFDAITDKMIIELKSSKIPSMTPWPDHNLQMNSYLKIIEKHQPYQGTVLYINNGEMGLKHPTQWDHNQTLIARNYVVLVQNGKYIPLVLRGPDSKICNKCFEKSGCHKLCAGLETQRDCNVCQLSPFCSKIKWIDNTIDYLGNYIDALSAEEREIVNNQFLFSPAEKSTKTQNKMLSDGEILLTNDKISEIINNGLFITEFSISTSKTQFRRGDLVKAYPTDITYSSVTLYYNIRITEITENHLVVESINSLPDNIFIVPTHLTSLPRSGRRAIYRAITSQSPLIKLLVNSYHQLVTLEKMSYSSSQLNHPLIEYNSLQTTAINYALTTPDLFVIQGPAGTGKTSVIVEILHQLMLKDKIVLCSAFTNMAVDNVGIKLQAFNIPFIRLGNLHSMHPKLHVNSIVQQPDLLSQLIQKKGPLIVLSTTSTIANQSYENLWFDYVLLDEAAQMTEADAIKPLLLSSKVILVGDHAQLQPIVLSQIARQYNLQISLFERLANNITNRFLLLQDQYRMNEEILKFPNKMFYQNKLRPATKQIALQSYTDVKGELVNSDPYQVIILKDASNNPFSQVNTSEAVVLVHLVYDLIQTEGITSDDIGIITPFRAQVAYLRNLLPTFSIDTIDRYQGSEREIIIFSTITMESIPIITDPRRINVALTRAKKKLIVILTNPQVQTDTLLDKLYLDAKERDLLTIVQESELQKLQICLTSIRSKLCKQLGVPSEILIEPIAFIDQVPKARATKIYYNTTQLFLSVTDGEETCVLCYGVVIEGIQCRSCQYWYHHTHLYDWLRQKSYCAVCKHSLIIK